MRTSICLRSPPVFLIDLLRLILSRFFSVLWLTALTSSPEFSVARVLTWTNSHITFQTNYRPFKIQQNIDFSTSLLTCYVAACSLLAARLSEWALGSDWALGWAQLSRKVAPAPSHLLTKKQLQPQIRFWLMANETVSPHLPFPAFLYSYEYWMCKYKCEHKYKKIAWVTTLIHIISGSPITPFFYHFPLSPSAHHY